MKPPEAAPEYKDPFPPCPECGTQMRIRIVGSTATPFCAMRGCPVAETPYWS